MKQKLVLNAHTFYYYINVSNSSNNGNIDGNNNRTIVISINNTSKICWVMSTILTKYNNNIKSFSNILQLQKQE